MKQQLATDEDFRFLQDLRKYAEEKVGQLTYPEALLKRVLKENNKDKDDEFINKNYEASLKDLTWSLIKNKLAEKAEVKVNDVAAIKPVGKLNHKEISLEDFNKMVTAEQA